MSAIELNRWLASHGLERLEATLLANRVDLDVLPLLSSDDLQAIGIPLGDVKRLLRAAPTAIHSTPAHYACVIERRQLSILFCDLVASTHLTQVLDAEDFREVNRRYRVISQDVIKGAQGHLTQFQGDGVEVYFGYPSAREDDALRAVRAGLELIDGVRDLNRTLGEDLGVDVACRVGIATGNVVIGPMPDEAAGRPVAFGEVPNLASRLQTLALPNQLVVAATTRKLIARACETLPIGAYTLKGFEEPVEAFEVRGQRSAVEQFELGLSSAPTPFVGRQEELHSLLSSWQSAHRGEGCAVLVRGEAGSGKSRLVSELQRSLGDKLTSRLLYFGAAQHQTSPLYPVVEQLARALRWHNDDATATRLQKLHDLAERLALGRAILPALTHVLGLPVDTDEPLLGLSAAEQKRTTYAALISLIRAIASREPTLIVMEDVHWMDPSTRELWNLFLSSLKELRVLCVLTQRSDADDTWELGSDIPTLTLNRLEQDEARQLVLSRMVDFRPSRRLVDDIVAKADSVPLYLEELTQTVVDAGLTDSASGLGEHSVPATLQDLLMARLDKQTGAKETAQLGAVLGRHFSRELLHVASTLSPATVDAHVAVLLASGLVRERAIASEQVLEFKHALVQDVAYGSLVRDERAQFHSNVADALMSTPTSQSKGQAELLAWHFTRAGRRQEAIDKWRAAGRLAVKGAANLEASVHFDKALELLHELPVSVERDRLELDLLVEAFPPRLAVFGSGRPEIESAFKRAFELCSVIDQAPNVFPIFYQRWIFNLTVGRLTKTLDYAKEFLQLAEHQQNEDAKMVGHRVMGWSLCALGQPRAALEEFEDAQRRYDPIAHERLTNIYGFDQGVGIGACMVKVLWVLGQYTRADILAEESLQQAEASQHPMTRFLAYQFCGALHNVLMQRWDRVMTYGERSLELGRELGWDLPDMSGRFYSALAAVHLSGDAGAIDAMQQAVADSRAAGYAFHMPFWYMAIAEACGLVGKTAEGLAALDNATDLATANHEAWHLPDLYRLRGLLQRDQMGGADVIERSLLKAVEIANVQGAPGWGLRAANSLAGEWLVHKRVHEAQALVSSALGDVDRRSDVRDITTAETFLAMSAHVIESSKGSAR